MHILEVEISNTKKIKAFRVKIDGRNMRVAGDTGQGKTTAISALWDIIEKKADALTHGKKKGHIKITLGGGNKTIVAKRVNTKSASTIKLSDAEGKAVSIKDFKRMISDLSVNPHKIANMKPKEQVATLLKAANLGDFDMESVDGDIAKLEQERLEQYRIAENYKPGPEPEKVERVNTSDLVEQVSAANEAQRVYKDKSKLLSSLEEERQELESRLEKVNERIAAGKPIVKKLKSKLVDPEPLKEKLRNVEEINSKANTYEKWLEKNKSYKDHKQRHADINEKIRELRDAKEEALDNADWPLEGLSIEDGEILYNGSLLSNLGQSEQMLVCAALAMEDIKNHPVRVVRMDGIESMSTEDFDKLESMFNGNGVQVLSSRVARKDVEEGEIEIVEGEYVDGRL